MALMDRSLQFHLEETRETPAILDQAGIPETPETLAAEGVPLLLGWKETWPPWISTDDHRPDRILQTPMEGDRTCALLLREDLPQVVVEEATIRARHDRDGHLWVPTVLWVPQEAQPCH